MFDVIGSADVQMLSRDELIDRLKSLETHARQLVAACVRIDAELESRGIPYELGYSSVAVMLSDVLRLSPGEARSRVRLARRVGPRRAVTGEVLEPELPLVARALELGEISARHADAIVRTVDDIPDHVLDDPDRAALAAEAEATLVEHAQTMDPVHLAAVGRRLVECLDPDGQLELERAQERRRDVTLTVVPDGSGRLSGYLTAQATAVWLTVLSGLSAPAPAADGSPDPRGPGHRRHDGLLDAGLRLLRSGALPESGGTPVTILLSMTVDQFEQRSGLVTAEHGGTLSVAAALELAAAADVVPTILDQGGGVLAYGRARRIASERQRRTLAVRDRGCSFPGCDRPPAWTEAHHVKAWADGGNTDVPNLTLLCGHHHRHHAKLGWTCTMHRGVPYWIPPRWIDKEQIPRRNKANHLPIIFPVPATAAAT